MRKPNPALMKPILATEVRKNFSEFLDRVVHEKPMIVKRARDHVLVIDLVLFQYVLPLRILNPRIRIEKDDSITCMIEALDLSVHAEDRSRAIHEMAAMAESAAVRFFVDFAGWPFNSVRKAQVPLILSILAHDRLALMRSMYGARVDAPGRDPTNPFGYTEDIDDGEDDFAL